jgi:hypothetical protein
LTTVSGRVSPYRVLRSVRSREKWQKCIRSAMPPSDVLVESEIGKLYGLGTLCTNSSAAKTQLNGQIHRPIRRGLHNLPIMEKDYTAPVH